MCFNLIQEIWKNVPGYSDYSISDLGRVHSKRYNRELSGTINRDGYRVVTISRDKKSKPFLVHRLVADSFVLGRTPLRQVNHIDGDKLNNAATNLEWVKPEENIRHAVRLNLNTRVKPNGISARRWVRVVETGHEYRNQSACARALGVSSYMVSKVLSSNGRWTVRGYHLEYVD